MRNAMGWVALGIVACAPASTVQRMRGPDGEPGWISIECHGHQSNCFARAAQECPEGYGIAGQTGGYGAVSYTQESGDYSGKVNATKTGPWVNGTSNGTYTGSSTTYTMPVYNGELFIKCHDRDVRAGSAGDQGAGTGVTHKPTVRCSGQSDCPWFGYECKDGWCVGQ